jgi:uncharacterized protein YdaU (DUF1376 family)
MKKGKDPALLFYTADFLVGTMTMSLEQRGAYITLLCLQHQTGHLSLDDIHKFTTDEAVLAKFVVDDNGNYYNMRTESETIKRAKHSDKQKNNIKRRWCEDSGNTVVIPKRYQTDTNSEDVGNDVGNTVVIPLENENETEKDLFHFPHTLDNKKDLSVSLVNDDTEGICTEENAREGETGAASGADPPKKNEAAVRHKHGKYKHVLLTAKQYDDLVADFGQADTEDCIKKVDEWCEETGNRKKNYSVTIRKWRQGGWGNNKQNESKTSTVTGRKMYDRELRRIEELEREEALKRGNG